MAGKLEPLFGGHAAIKCDFDLFFSPVGSRLGGMRNYNPMVLNEGYGFAGLLADAMEQAKNQKGVVWASDRGGSVVLTQALQTLASKKMSFNEQRHIVAMRQPTTSPVPAMASAKNLGMTCDKKMAGADGHVYAAIGSLMANAARARDKSDIYSWNDYAKDLSNASMAGVTAVGALSAGAGLLVASPFFVKAGALAGTIGAVHWGLKAAANIVKR